MKHNKKDTSLGEVHSHHAFDNVELHSKRFDSAERDEWQKPDQVVDSLNLSDDATVLEIGAGTGYFTVRLAQYLKKGKVIVLESSSKMAAYLKDRVTNLSLSNVDILLSEANSEQSIPQKVDLIMCVDSYHHITERSSYFQRLKQQLNYGGKLVIIDRPVDSPDAPPHGHQTPPELVEREMKQAGFELIQKYEFLLPHQFYLAFKTVEQK